MDKMFMKVDEVMEALDVSESYAYKLIRKLNKELANDSSEVNTDLLNTIELITWTMQGMKDEE